MFANRNNGAIAATLVFAVLLWGGNNTGIKYIVKEWPPIWVGCTRFACAGFLMLAILRWTSWLGGRDTIPPEVKRRLWTHGGMSLAVYIVVFNWALRFTSASHVALYLGAAPVWALLWEGSKGQDRMGLFKRYAAATLALSGVLTLFWPTLKSSSGSLPGELLGISASVLWTLYGRQCRALGAHLSGVGITAHTMWRAGVLLAPMALLEAASKGIVWRGDLIAVQAYCIIAGGVIAFALWNNALRHWKTSEVFLFNNLIPLSTMLWAHFCLGEAITPTFWLAMAMIVSGVVIGQTQWQKLLGNRRPPTE